MFYRGPNHPGSIKDYHGMNPADLLADHPLRNTPMKVIGIEVRNRKSAAWRKVDKWRIGASTFNEIVGAWGESNEFRIPDQVARNFR
jgi:hypothetical protein